jgi:hypothetical protein
VNSGRPRPPTSLPLTLGTSSAERSRADPALAWRRRAAWHRRTALLPLGYLAAAVVTGVLALTGRPLSWLLLHLLLLGAVSNAIVVWSGHFAATILHAPAAERRLPEAARLAALNVGIGAVLAGGSAGPTWLALAGAGVVFAAIAAHLAALAAMTRRALPARFTVVVWYYLAAGIALLTGIPAGAWMLTEPDSQRPRILLFHVQVNVFGWIALTVLGTLVTLWPTVLRARVADTATQDARRGLIACSAGLIMLATGAAWWQRPLAALGLAAFATGAAIALRPAVAAARQRPPATFAALSIAASTCWLLVIIGWDGWVLLSAARPAAAAGQFDLLAVALAVGFASQILVGALAYLLPMAIGGGPATVRQNAASMDKYRWSRIAAANAGLVAILWPPLEAARVAGAAMVAASAVMFLVPAATLAVRSRRQQGFR